MRLVAVASVLLIFGWASAQQILPPPNSQIKQEFTLLNADFVESLLGDDISVSGSVHAQYKGYDLYADKIVGDRKTQIFTLSGNCRLVGKGSDVTGEEIKIDFTSETFTFRSGSAIVSPESLQGATQEKVFVKSNSGEGSLGEFSILEGLLTTCDLAQPHSLFEVRSSKIRPGRYVALRDAKLNVLGHTLIRIPYLVLPLVENGTRYLPDVGQSPTEGYFVKTRISTPLRGDDYVDTRLDYMTELGTGIGADLNYEKSSMKGKLSIYGLIGEQRSATITSSHSQNMGSGRLQLDTSYQRLNYLTAPESTLFNSRAQYVFPWSKGNTRLSWYRISSDRSTFSSINQNISLNDSHTWSSAITTNFDIGINRSETNSITTDSQAERLDIRFNSRSDLRSFTADLLFQRSIPVGDTLNFVSATDRTPMLTLKSDANRLIGPNAARKMPFTSEFSIGELADPASGGTISRVDFNVFSQRRETIGRSTLALNGGFKQGLYSDDTAQYIYDYGIGLSYALAERSRIDVNYKNHRAFGYTPLSIDRTGRNDAFAIDLVFQPSSTLDLSARTGYDVLQSDRGNVPWQQVWLRADWRPTENFLVRTSSTYDTFNQVWGNNRIDLGLKQGDFKVGLGSRYDGRRSVWAGTSLLLQGLKFGRTEFSTALDWNGYRQRFDAQHFSIVYDLHEAEAVLDFIDNQAGFRSGRQIALFVRLKAFPTSSAFGSGTRGQAVGTQPGFGF